MRWSDSVAAVRAPIPGRGIWSRRDWSVSPDRLHRPDLQLPVGLREGAPRGGVRIDDEPERLQRGQLRPVSGQCYPRQRPVRVVRPRDERGDGVSPVSRPRVAALGSLRRALSVEGALWALIGATAVYLGFQVLRAVEVVLR
jgi:hypothetical protein